MVGKKKGKPTKMDEDWGYPHFSKPPSMFWMVTDYEISCVVM